MDYSIGSYLRGVSKDKKSHTYLYGGRPTLGILRPSRARPCPGGIRGDYLDSAPQNKVSTPTVLGGARRPNNRADMLMSQLSQAARPGTVENSIIETRPPTSAIW
ncbi:hypothetical protein Nepgr_024984 [Nepenthes gracilis]|uniref:Uncharacterized protein n=1 Tax=Nepenthes gracilis TaxID=150966 RepID=A0AAD3T5V8_NEPGR|nr:hypothetical protein Nepgr_024984 [Nepenthes gracilis]